tara:strand:+ start:215 stop:640 length:426 start_codon:yes stop_codon:yes gene_type:complete
MKKHFIFFLLLMSNLALAEWTLIFESSDSKSKYFADLSNIKVNEKHSKLRLWTIEDFIDTQEAADHKNKKGRILYLSVKSYAEFDCKNLQIRIMAYSVYEENMAKGERIFSKGTPWEWEKINENTIYDLYQRKACKTSGLS